jgi:hypothetical protein
MTTSSMSLSACAPFVAPRLCSTKTRRNKKSAGNIRRRHRAVRRRGQFCCLLVVGNFLACRSSALYCRQRSLPFSSAFSRRRSDANERRQRSICRAFWWREAPVRAFWWRCSGGGWLGEGRSGRGRLRDGRF